MSEDKGRTWIGIGEAADILEVPPKIVQDWMDKGHIHFVKSYMTGLPWLSRVSVEDLREKMIKESIRNPPLP